MKKSLESYRLVPYDSGMQTTSLLKAGFIKHLGQFRAVLREKGRIIWLYPYACCTQVDALHIAKTELWKRSQP